MIEQKLMQQSALVDKKNSCMYSILYVSLIILLFQAISNTQLGIISQFSSQNGNTWIGPLSTSLLFLGSCIGSTYNKYINTIKYNVVFFIGSLGYTIFIGMEVVFLTLGFGSFVEIGVLIGSFVAGIVVSAFYNAQFNYVNTCSKIDNQKTKYFGINLSIGQSANILGNLVSALLITPLGQYNYAIVMNISVFAVSLLFLKVKDYKLPLGLVQQGQVKQITSLIQIQSEEEIIIKAPIPWSLVFCFSFSGIMISFIYCQLSLIFYSTFSPYYSKQQLNQITFIGFIIQGVGQFMGGLTLVFCSRQIERVGVSNVFIMVGSLFLIGIAAIYVAMHHESVAFTYVACFFVGIADCLGFSLGLAIAGHYQHQGITLFNIGQSGTVAIASILIAFLDFQYLIVLSVIVHLLSTMSILSNRQTIDSNSKNQ